MSGIKQQDNRFIMKTMERLESKHFDELYDLYYDCKLKIQNNVSPLKKHHLTMIAIKKVVDLKEYELDEGEMVIFPDYNDKGFNQNISKKAEFFYNKSTFNILELQKKCLVRNFELGNHQILLRNLIHPNSPYNGLLIFHGVGVGKTCSGITISNSFRDIYMKEKKKKIIILVPKNIQPGWKNTIYNSKLGENQCTGDTFNYIIRNNSGFNKERGVEKKIKKTIKEFYEIYGYQEFSNQIRKLIEMRKGGREDDDKFIEREVIKEYFSDRLLIIDEVHNIRSEKEKLARETVININKVIEYSENLKLILLSATPMFNQPTEIVWLVNMLLKNDKRPTISEEELFEGNAITEEGKQLLARKCKGYVSYLRGENPITFPIRLYPVDNIQPYPTLSFSGEEELTGYEFKFMKLYNNIFKDGGEQHKTYENFVSSLAKEKKLSLSLTNMGKQISNISYPNNLSGENGFNKCMVFSKQYSYHKGYPKIFDEENIENYSTKIKKIIEKVKSSEGIIFIYSEYIYSGIIPLALALEHCGYHRLSGNLLDEKEKDKKGKKKLGTYIILSGDKKLSPNNEQEIKMLTKDNTNGEKIKIVIGSVVASEGLDLKNIREIHVMEPWFHLNRLEQIVGRGIRYCSHISIKDPKKRNVSVYLHTGVVDHKRESVDTYIYREAESKAYDIGQVEVVLKENAVDCYLNQSANIIKEKDVLPVSVIDSQGVSDKVDVHDKEFSKICSWSSKCSINCKVDDKITEKDINFSTFNVDFSKELLKKIKNIIMLLFSEQNYYQIDGLMEKITDDIKTDDNIIFYALSDMIENKDKIWDFNGNQGHLIFSNDIYIFQPYFYDEQFISNYNRNHIIVSNVSYINLEKQIDTIIQDDNLLDIGGIEAFKENIKKYGYLKKQDFLNEYILNDYAIDHLQFKEKKNLIENIIINKDYSNPYFRSIENNLIKEKLQILNVNPLEIVGYFITDYKTVKILFFKLNKEDNTFSKFNAVDERTIKRNIKYEIKYENIYGYPIRNKTGKYYLKYVDKDKYPRGTILSSDNNKIDSIIEAFKRIEHYDDVLETRKEAGTRFEYGRNELSICMDVLLRNISYREENNIFIGYDLFNILNLK